MELQDALSSCKWRVDMSVQKLKSDIRTINQTDRKTSFKPKRQRMKVDEENVSDSEEDEYNNTGIVYDSENSDDEFDIEEEQVKNRGKIERERKCV